MTDTLEDVKDTDEGLLLSHDRLQRVKDTLADYKKQQAMSKLTRAVATGRAAVPALGAPLPPPPPPAATPTIPQPDPQDPDYRRQLIGEDLFKLQKELDSLQEVERRYLAVPVKTQSTIFIANGFLAKGPAAGGYGLQMRFSAPGKAGVNLRYTTHSTRVTPSKEIDSKTCLGFTFTGLQGIITVATEVSDEATALQLLQSPAIRSACNIPAANTPHIERNSVADNSTTSGTKLRNLIRREIGQLPSNLRPPRSQVTIVQKIFTIVCDVLGCSYTSRTAANRELAGAAFSETFRMTLRLLGPLFGIPHHRLLYEPTIPFALSFPVNELQTPARMHLSFISNDGPVQKTWSFPSDEEAKLADTHPQPKFSKIVINSNTTVPNPTWTNSIDASYANALANHPGCDHSKIPQQIDFLRKAISAYEAALSAYPRPYFIDQRMSRIDRVLPYFKQKQYKYGVRVQKQSGKFFVVEQCSEKRIISGFSSKLEAQRMRAYLCDLHHFSNGDLPLVRWYALLRSLANEGRTPEELASLTRELLPLPPGAIEFFCNSCFDMCSILDLVESPIDTTRWCKLCRVTLVDHFGGDVNGTSFKTSIKLGTNPLTPYARLFDRVDHDDTRTGQDVSGGTVEERKALLESQNPLWLPQSDGFVADAYLGDALGPTTVSPLPHLSGDAVHQGIAILVPGKSDPEARLHNHPGNVAPTSGPRNIMMQDFAKQSFKLFTIEITLQRLRRNGVDTRIEQILDGFLEQVRNCLLLIANVERKYDYPYSHHLGRKRKASLQEDFDRITSFDFAQEEVFIKSTGPGSVEHLREHFPDYKDMVATVDRETYKDGLGSSPLQEHRQLRKLPLFPSEDLDAIRKFAKELEAKYNLKFKWYESSKYGSLPCFFSEVDVKLFESRQGNKFSVANLVNEIFNRLARYIDDCNRLYFDENVTLRSLYFTFLLFLAEGDGKHSDQLLGSEVIFMTPNDPHSGGIGHSVQGRTMAVPFDTPEPTTLADYNAEILNVRIRGWRARLGIYGWQREKNDETVESDLLGIYRYVLKLFSSNALKIDSADSQNVANAIRTMLDDPEFVASAHISNLLKRDVPAPAQG